MVDNANNTNNIDSPAADTPTQPKHHLLSQKSLTWIAVILVLAILTVWVFLTPDGIFGKADAIGYAVCHRITIRSFAFPDGVQLPVCARCTGTFLGVLVGLLGPGVMFGRRRAAMFPPVPIMGIMLVFSAVWAFDGANSYTFLLGPTVPHLYVPNNTLRLITGMGQGITMGSLLLPVLNSMLWADPRNERTVENIWHLLALVGIGAVLVGMILSGLGIFLYPLALLSALGVVIILSAINTVVAAALLGRENSAHTLADALPLVLLGITLSFVLIGGIDLVRFTFTGTWGSFISPPV
jgi:uncharacterized membrane protein